MHLTEKLADQTKELCGVVAITLHPHLEKFWRKGIELCSERKIRTNFHFIVSDKESINLLDKMYSELKNVCEYFVLLPYMNVGFASGDNAKTIDYDALNDWLKIYYSEKKIAFGSNMYDFLLQNKYLDVSLYPPERMSKYVIFDDPIKVYNNSFEMHEVEFDHLRKNL
jgi:hypothetical protein